MTEPRPARFKMAPLSVSLAVLTLALGGLTIGSSSVLPLPVAKKVLQVRVEAAALLQRKRFLLSFEHGADAFRNRDLSREDRSYLETIPRASSIYELKLFDGDGRIFWSSIPLDLGSTVAETESFDIIESGSAAYSSGYVPRSSIANAEFHNLAETGRREHFVGVSHVPILASGEVVGGFQVKSDLTSELVILAARSRIAFLVAGTLACLASAVMTVVVSRLIARQRQVNHERRTRERQALETQVDLARDVQLLGELNEWLQSSNSLEELFSMIGRFLGHLMPDSEGAIYVYSNSRDVLDGGISWNGAPLRPHIRPDDCWGLRRGRYYFYGKSHVNFSCAHLEAGDERSYVCFPILAHGETVGLLHLRAREAASAEAFAADQRLARLCAEQISLAIANVRMRDELHDRSVRDPLTGLFNRRYITDALRRATDRDGAEAPFALVSLDVDHFKKFNDTFGHDAGDTVLRTVGDVLSHAVDGDEIACRMGGEEFMLYLPGHGAEAASARAESLRETVERIAVRYGDKTLPTVTVSIGVSICPDHGRMPQQLIRAADDALYAAKDGGRNRVEIAGAAPSQTAAIAAE